ncbi:30S ribosomal protein S10 [[Mycoplasma] mobile]|uniref:Small ribosomal subunit protein uS10 n=1 Tax=Mycoplasma mobile (strain ATCC 43663 / 163K / NCTC 11711) TaxID=267748 RepID=RS10_MYCM1|nr:30S ribosomal protein S10 [[Mycoplasma] mobile]Q6KI56.1 RecName: Full=Small ribosomal subunit protein uS10; AltName: Full=30S ribosomal protein S10 [Mycoplasma mobile 163K]AAT27720.1 30S ribosomal protein s10 [Mycoplasma mobile 163K]
MSKIKIKLKSFDADLIEEVSKKFVAFAKSKDIKMSGPIPLPTKIERITILRSVHVNKDSREQFESRTHKRLIIFENLDKKMLDALKRQEISTGVQVEIKEIN